jgi:hypothetical protein
VNRQGLPLDASVQEELAKRVFILVCCFDLVIDFAARTADLVEVEVQPEDGTQVAS